MPTFRVTAKRDFGGGKIPKGCTVQVITPNGVNSVDPRRIEEALKDQLGITISGFGISSSDFDIVKL